MMNVKTKTHLMMKKPLVEHPDADADVDDSDGDDDDDDEGELDVEEGKDHDIIKNS